MKNQRPPVAKFLAAKSLAVDPQAAVCNAAENPLQDYFENHKTGPGLWKWQHYFPAYHRHLSAFRNKPVHVLEVGVYSGGSLGMWTEYFGPKATILGVDIEPTCKVYEAEQVKITVGDQGSREFWREFIRENCCLDVVIDDGSHLPNDQIVTFEELFPSLRPGGVYICEDVHDRRNPFMRYACKIADSLNGFEGFTVKESDPEHFQFLPTNDIQRCVESISFYPFLVVFTKRWIALDELNCPKHGTEWQPFLGH